MAYIKYKNLVGIRRKYKNQKIVFCSGSFDITHVGHILFFEDCKKHGDILVVGVGNDIMLRRNKGKYRPILNQHVRLKMIDSIKSVDYCFLDESTQKDHKLQIVNEVLKKLKPDIYVINDDAFDFDYRKKVSDKYGVKLVMLKRSCPSKFESISTSGIIKRIMRLKD